MLFAIIVLGVAGALILAFVHPPEPDRAKWVKLLGAAFVVAALVLLVLLLAGVFDAETDGDADAALAAPGVLLLRLRRRFRRRVRAHYW